jgi:hypothetical protein
VAQIRNASVEELVPFVGEKLARKVKKKLTA